MKEYLYEDFKERYYKELERKENYNNKIGTVLTIYSLISVPLAYCVNSITNIMQNINSLVIIFFVLLLIAIILFAISIYYAIRSFWGHKYKYLPTPIVIDKLLSDTASYYDTYNEYFSKNYIQKKEYIRNRKNEVMYEYYRDATTNNLLRNDKKIKNFNRWTYIMGISVVFILTSCILLQFI